MSEGDPTDNVLAAIASILDRAATSDKPAVHDAHEPEAARDEPVVADEVDHPVDEAVEEPQVAPPVVPGEAAVNADDDVYTKLGPGPLAAIRFKWATRRGDNGDYFVDETIGENSHLLVSGPMPREAAIRFVDDRERSARERFEALRSEMTSGEIGNRRGEHS